MNSVPYGITARLIHQVGRAERRRRLTQRWVTAVATSFVLALLCGWMFMIAVGVAHHEWLPELPTIGYGWSVTLIALLRSAFASPSSTDNRD